MKLISLQSGGIQNGVPVYGAQVETDTGARFSFWVDGRTLDHPVTFAEFAASSTQQPCTSEYIGDAGGWHAHLGDALRRSTGPAQPTSNASAAAITGNTDAERRAALLSATPLGKATVAAEAAAASFAAPVPPPAPEVTFAQKCQQDAEAADRARRAGLAKYLKLTSLGRDVLAQDANKS